MFTQIDPSLVLLVLLMAAAFAAVESISERRKRQQAIKDAERRVAIRQAIEDDRCHSYPASEVFEELKVMVVDTTEWVSNLTNRRLELELGADSAYVTKSPEQMTRDTFAVIYGHLDEHEFEKAVGAMAFILKAIADQVRRLRDRSTVFTVGNFLGQVCDGEFDIRLDRRRFTFASKSEAVWLLCDVFNDIREQLPALQRMDRRPDEPLSKRPRRGPKRRRRRS
jgi:hypothetical protein